MLWGYLANYPQVVFIDVITTCGTWSFTYANLEILLVLGNVITNTRDKYVRMYNCLEYPHK